MKINWVWKTYQELTKDELYSILKHRNACFIVEKKCPWDEVDGQDHDALHLLGFTASKPISFIAYARLQLPVSNLDPLHFGRLSVAKPYRGQGISNLIMDNILNKITQLNLESRRIDILANDTPETQKLYKKFGFVVLEEPYEIEGGTKLVKMSRPASVALSIAPTSTVFANTALPVQKKPNNKFLTNFMLKK